TSYDGHQHRHATRPELIAAGGALGRACTDHVGPGWCGCLDGSTTWAPGGHDCDVGPVTSSAPSAGATCPRTHAAGGSRSSISVRRCSNPASVSRPASSLAAAAEVAAVAPGQRGGGTRAIRPPGTEKTGTAAGPGGGGGGARPRG